ncbi:MAG: right-handed parallel beta-helix repeat-containing protein [Deltaproteobacteria bacterium]|nr:right-handed parallel beta-helix repeat-containing protein [Deltaproteobacteria bacterium]
MTWKSTLIVCLALLMSMVMGFGCISETEQDEVSSNVYYVSNQGDDDADGQTRETAFRTIGQALEVMRLGNTILILPGTYNEALTLEDVGSSSAPITIRGEDGVAVLDGKKNMTMGFWCEKCTNFIFENLEIRYYTDIGIGVSLSSNITMRNLTVHHNGMNVQLEDWELEGYGIHAEESKKITIENNDVYRNGPQPKSLGRLMGTGINTFGLIDSVILNNRSHDNTGGGILVEDGVNILVEGNEIFSNDLDASIEEWWDGGIWLDGGHDVTVQNNIFKNNKGPGIEISDEDHQKPYGYVLENNISTENYYGIYIWNFGTSDFPPENVLRMSNNQFFGNTRKDIWVVPWQCPPPDPCD